MSDYGWLGIALALVGPALFVYVLDWAEQGYPSVWAWLVRRRIRGYVIERIHKDKDTYVYRPWIVGSGGRKLFRLPDKAWLEWATESAEMELSRWMVHPLNEPEVVYYSNESLKPTDVPAGALSEPQNREVGNDEIG